MTCKTMSKYLDLRTGPFSNDLNGLFLKQIEVDSDSDMVNYSGFKLFTKTLN